LTGKAESAGRSGDMVAIRNMTSNKLFQARITGKGKALVDAGRAHEN
jgi:flagella basal body P-ring formation protein FlgA